jgi:hypothetical protein
MTNAAPSTEVVLAEPAANERERLALAGFLAGYVGLTRDSYALDLRQFVRWSQLSRHAPVRGARGRHRVLRRELEAQVPCSRHRQPPSLNCGRFLALRR